MHFVLLSVVERKEGSYIDADSSFIWFFLVPSNKCLFRIV